MHKNLLTGARRASRLERDPPLCPVQIQTSISEMGMGLVALHSEGVRFVQKFLAKKSVSFFAKEIASKESLLLQK